MALKCCRPVRLASQWALLLVCFDVAGLAPSLSSAVAAEPPEMVKVSAVSGGDATLPCDTRSPQLNDVLLLVVWYKNDIPVYSYDSRNKGSSPHWADDVLAGRARWHATAPSSLRLRDVLGTDRALYRCRVDFKISPTRNQKVQLDVIELPEKPKVFDELDTEVVGMAGPYVEGTSLKLTCVVNGGKPSPRLRWWRDDKVIATQPAVEGVSRKSVLELRIPKLNREYFEAVYTCTADNTALVPAMRVSVQILLYLRPLMVEILPREQPLSVGQEAQISCRAVGARPPAIITWWLEETQISDSSELKDTDNRNETVSILHWTPRMEHNGRVLTCRAAHEKLEYTTIETRITLDLHYVPIVVLQLGSKLNPNDIEEGDDVYFECTVQSNPPAYKVVWEHNDQVMTHNQRAGVIAGSAHLALQVVSKGQAGKYSCTASNVEGDGKSKPVYLQVIYKPICITSKTAIVGAAFNEPTRVVCQVDAIPPPENFQWILNNSMGAIEIDASKFEINSTGYSILNYKPVTEADYGSLACRANNLAGLQVEPCRFTLMPAVKPEQPYNCSSVNLTEDSAELRCIAGYDGGLQTMYVVEAWESGKVVLNETSSQPIWKLHNLGSGKALKLLFYAFNAKGKSETTKLRVYTLTRMALHTEATTGDNENANGAFLIIAGISATIILIVIVAFIARRRHHHSMRYEGPLHTVKAYKGSLHSGDHSPQQPDDKNPDVVPLGKDFKCTRDVECTPDPPPYGVVISPPVVTSRSVHSLHKQDLRTCTPQTPNTPAYDVQSIETLVDDRRSVTSGTFSRRREVVTTRTPLLANARESCV